MKSSFYSALAYNSTVSAGVILMQLGVFEHAQLCLSRNGQCANLNINANIDKGPANGCNTAIFGSCAHI